jgi:hypothetical protein
MTQAALALGAALLGVAGAACSNGHGLKVKLDASAGTIDAARATDAAADERSDASGAQKEDARPDFSGAGGMSASDASAEATPKLDAPVDATEAAGCAVNARACGGACIPLKACCSDDDCAATEPAGLPASLVWHCVPSSHSCMLASCDAVPGRHLCGSECAFNSATASCGANCAPCLVPAHGSATCDGSRCGFTCDSGFLACADGCIPASACVATASATSCDVTSVSCGACGGMLKCDLSCSTATPIALDAACSCGGSVGCDGRCSGGADAGTANVCPAPTTGVLISDLEYPTGLWVKGTKVYIAECPVGNTSFSGRDRLSVYDTSTKVRTTLLEDPPDCGAVAVAGDDKIWLGTRLVTNIDGDSGHISVLDPTTLQVVQSISVAIAVSDLFPDGDDVYVAGLSDTADAKNIYVVHAGVAVPFRQGLGWVSAITKVGSTLYYSIFGGAHPVGTSRFVGNTGDVEMFSTSGRQALTSSPAQIFFADLLSNVIGSVDQQTKQATGTPLTGLNGPFNVRYDVPSGLLFFVESGTVAGKYLDGRLQAVVPSVQ